jgi:hypothetical protein
MRDTVRFVLVLSLLATLFGGAVVGATITPSMTPEVFADQLVSLYNQRPHTPEDGHHWDQWHDSLFDPEFSKLIANNRTLSNKVWQSPPSIHGDPICGCEGFVNIQIWSVGLRSSGLAEIKAAYHRGPPSGNQSPNGRTNADLDLVHKRINGAWKLYDVMHLAGRPGGVRDQLIRENACMRLVEKDTHLDRAGSTYQRCISQTRSHR